MNLLCDAAEMKFPVYFRFCTKPHVGSSAAEKTHSCRTTQHVANRNGKAEVNWKFHFLSVTFGV